MGQRDVSAKGRSGQKDAIRAKEFEQI